MKKILIYWGIKRSTDTYMEICTPAHPSLDKLMEEYPALDDYVMKEYNAVDIINLIGENQELHEQASLLESEMVQEL